jgi:hypothetical protein
MSTNFIVLGAIDQKLWVFENFIRSMAAKKKNSLKLFWVGFFFINS